MFEYELIFTILNRGYSDLVMDSARANGATGGTIITARGTGAKITEKLFGISISEEKEIILILTERSKRNALMRAICASAGLNTQGRGITFSMPVDDVLGVSLGMSPDMPAPRGEDGDAAEKTGETPDDSPEDEEVPPGDGTDGADETK